MSHPATKCSAEQLGQNTRVITRRQWLRVAATGAGLISVARPQPTLAQSADATTLARLQADLTQHAAFGPKNSASPGDTANANWIATRLRTAGYRVDESSFDAPYFTSRTARLTAGSTSVTVLPQLPVTTTPAAGITAPLALVTDAVGNVKGRIAVVVLPFGRHAALFANRGIGQTVKRTADAGASAIVIVTTGPSGLAVGLNVPETGFVPVPMALLAPRDAEPIVQAAKAGANATLVLDGDATHRPCRNIVARLERGDRWLAISTPRSGWSHCVAERGTGTAVFLEMAAWATTRFPKHSLFLMNTGGHEFMFAGSHRVLPLAPPPEKTDVWTHIGASLATRDAVERDGTLVLLDTADPQRNTMATDSARAATAEGFRGLSGLDKPGVVQPNAGELSTFTDKGYRTAFAAIGVHRWFHTAADTLDKVDARLLFPVLRAHQRTLELLVERS